MEPSASRVPAKPLDGERFARFLAWLDPDAEAAGRKYRELHVRLTKIFACRGCETPEELADTAFNRAALKIEAILEQYQGEPARYLYGVARNVFREHLRARRRSTASRTSWGDGLPPGAAGADERTFACLEHCLGTALAPAERELILDYYGERHRRRAAPGADGPSGSAVRKRTQRLRDRLKQCVLDCLAGKDRDAAAGAATPGREES